MLLHIFSFGREISSRKLLLSLRESSQQSCRGQFCRNCVLLYTLIGSAVKVVVWRMQWKSFLRYFWVLHSTLRRGKGNRIYLDLRYIRPACKPKAGDFDKYKLFVYELEKFRKEIYNVRIPNPVPSRVMSEFRILS